MVAPRVIWTTQRPWRWIWIPEVYLLQVVGRFPLLIPNYRDSRAIIMMKLLNIKVLRLRRWEDVPWIVRAMCEALPERSCGQRLAGRRDSRHGNGRTLPVSGAL